MKILVYGAGVLGSAYAAHLAEAGNEVSLLARGQRLAELREHGVVLENEATGKQSVTRLDVVAELAAEDAYDLIVVIVRKNQVSAVLPALAANRRSPNILFMVNTATGVEEWVRALGRERVLLGFPGAGGAREGHLVRYHILPGLLQPTTLGECDGRVTPRLRAVVAAFRRAGFPVEISRNMDAWLKTHVAVVSPIAGALYMFAGDNYRLAASSEGVTLCVRAMKEGFRVLWALGIQPTPPKLKVLLSLPEWVLVPTLRRMFATQMAETVTARHARAARDEMKQLADEFYVLVGGTLVPTPDIDHLYTYIDPPTDPGRTEGSEIHGKTQALS